MKLIYYYRYYDNGSLKHIISQFNGKNHGIETSYDEDGTVLFKCKWKDGKNIGWSKL